MASVGSPFFVYAVLYVSFLGLVCGECAVETDASSLVDQGCKRAEVSGHALLDSDHDIGSLMQLKHNRSARLLASVSANRAKRRSDTADEAIDMVSGWASDQIVGIFSGEPISWQEQTLGLTNLVLGVATTLFTINPVVGFFANLAVGLLGNLIGGGGDPMADLVKVILEEVDRRIAAQSLLELSGEMKDLTEELEWVPGMLAENTSTDVRLSYLLMIQHDLATKKRMVFRDDCVDADFRPVSKPPSLCLNWRKQERVLMLQFSFAHMHLDILPEIARLQESLRPVIAMRVVDYSTRYADLVKASYESFESARLGDFYVHRRVIWKHPRGGRSRYMLILRDRRSSDLQETLCTVWQKPGDCSKVRLQISSVRNTSQSIGPSYAISGIIV
eukprot:TRINITY_DN15792_c0_g1_i2.p1 TRINITY_DN15792_c0_g1~~TRINITY_DN15792_c0_g1_i2.p1  ORF type:complete len:389 (+),score=44.53 TRINITY_DN15792_c0_g1_i2:46-1212(+)